MRWFSIVHIVVLLAIVHRWVLGPWLRRRVPGNAPGGGRAEPTVTVVTPMFDAGLGIARTIRSVVGLDYPMHRLELVIVDDASRDDSRAVALRHAAPYPNVHILRNHHRMGWRYSFDRAVRRSGAEFVLALRPGDELHPSALRHLVRRAAPEVAAVGARVLAGRPDESWLGRLEAVRAFLDEAYLRSVEAASAGLPCGAAPCVTGRAALYRRDALLDLPPFPAQLVHRGTDGGDQSPLRQLLQRGVPTLIALDAVCFSDARPGPGACLVRPARRVRQVLSGAVRRAFAPGRRGPAAALQRLATAGMLGATPLVAAWSSAPGGRWDLAVFGAGTVLLATAVFAAWSSRLPEEHRVHPLWLVPALALLPVTAALLVPLAAFTLVPADDAPDAGLPDEAEPSAQEILDAVPFEPERVPEETVEVLPLAPASTAAPRL